MPKQLSALMFFFATVLGEDSAQAQMAKAVESNASAAQATIETEAPVRSATALGDIFFKSHDSFVFSMTAAQTAEDNLFFDADANKHSGTVSSISSRIAYQRQYQRSTVALDYTLRSRIYRQSNTYNPLSHAGGLDFQYRLTPRLSVSVGDQFIADSQSNRLFGTDLVVKPLPNDIVPNTSLFLRLNNKFIVNTAFTSFSYELSRRSQLTLGANSSIGRFEQSDLGDQVSYGARIRYSYLLAEKTTLSLGYTFNYFELSASHPSSAADSFIAHASLARNHLAYVGILQRLTPAVSVFVNVGPSLTIGDSVNLAQGTWLRTGVRPRIDAGILLSQPMSLDPRTFFSFNLSQGTTDGMGLGVVAELQMASVSLGRRLSKSATAVIGADYYGNKFPTEFDSPGQQMTTDGIMVKSSLRIDLTNRLFLNASYNHIRQLSTGALDAVPSRISGNVVLVGLSYSIPVFF